MRCVNVLSFTAFVLPIFGAVPSLPPRQSDLFGAKVLPLLQAKCLGCHGVGTTLGGLNLADRAKALKGGVRGPAFKPGDADNSLMIAMVTGRRQPVMPPNGALSKSEADLLRQWISAGAAYGTQPITSAAKQNWWSFQPVRLTQPPKLQNAAWVRTPVDAFILKELRANGLQPNPTAARRDLIRRAYFDLIGLPPSPEEVQAFLRDASPNAWEKVVDKLLASPHYGERWGRHWLDLVRYADSGGFEGDRDRPLAYRYRDYVIRSFNSDKPYNQFVREQIAGDEIDPGNPDALTATGYLAAGPQDIVMVNDKNRADELDDLVATTGSVFLGLTVGCARCHDHKYDPVTMRDYYRLSAVFAPTERRDLVISTPQHRKEVDEHNARIEAEAAPLRAAMAPARQRGIGLAKAGGNQNPNEDQIAAALPEPERKAYQEQLSALRKIEAKRRDYDRTMGVTDKGREAPPHHLLLRGDPDHKGPVVEPGFICALPGGDITLEAAPKDAATTQRRRALADWIADEKNPLTARVIVNRVWRQHFGRGLVATASNFGINGERPSHPELLDWLTREFTKSGWRLKPLHRLILTSNTWKQSSALQPSAAKKDPQNRWLWRMPMRRLEAEVIRDSILTTAGSLNPELFGPPVYPPVDPTLRADTFQGINWPEGEDSPRTWRRSIYVKVKRSLLLPQLEVFDCPEITYSVPVRNSTTTPLQALMLLNDPLVHRQSAEFARRLEKECGSDRDRWIDRAFSLCLGRRPSPTEKSTAAAYLQAHPLADFCHALFNLNEFLYSP
jgi:mono/diheme cytochrome c family protein